VISTPYDATGSWWNLYRKRVQNIHCLLWCDAARKGRIFLFVKYCVYFIGVATRKRVAWWVIIRNEMLILDLITRQPFDCEQKKNVQILASLFKDFVPIHRSRLPLSVKGDDVYTLIFAGHPRERFDNTVKSSCDILISSMYQLTVKF
jgi:hypothetical protein